MTVISRFPARLIALSAALACAGPLTAAAQVGGSGGGSDGGGPDAGSSAGAGNSSRGGGSTGRATRIDPYIEAGQIVTAELSPGDDVLTYSTVAAGVDAQIAGANSAISASVRYEHRFGWGEAEDADILSGIARGYAAVAPGLQLDAGALATRTRVDGNGSSVIGPLVNDDTVSQLYSLYAGPSLSTQAGDVQIAANYRFGYTKLEQPDAFVATPTARSVDVFDESTVHVASVHAGVRPYEVLPVGLGLGANYYREDISDLDQRAEEFRARADVSVPLSPSLALVGGLGYENVQISARDALRDADGVPIAGPDGQYVTDKGSPRTIAYDVDGLIWDVGVMWRPSRRTSLEAHVGRRYGTTSFWGSFAYAPNSRSSLNIAVYDNIAGFGGQVNRALADLPDEFTAVRNPLTGDIGGCVATLEQNGCLTNVLGSVRSATFRARGVTGTYAYRFGRLETGIGAGYDRRRFIAARGTILASSNGVLDENYWLAAYVNGQIDAKSSFTTNVYANWFKSGGLDRDSSAVGATAAYYRRLADKLRATVALGIDGVSQDEPSADFWNASALLGLSYHF